MLRFRASGGRPPGPRRAGRGWPGARRALRAWPAGTCRRFSGTQVSLLATLLALWWAWSGARAEPGHSARGAAAQLPAGQARPTAPAASAVLAATAEIHRGSPSEHRVHEPRNTLLSLRFSDQATTARVDRGSRSRGVRGRGQLFRSGSAGSSCCISEVTPGRITPDTFQLSAV